MCSTISVMVRSSCQNVSSVFDRLLELGILVWQDFMFGCGQVSFFSFFVSCSSGEQHSRKSKYPAYDAFLANVRLEAEQNVRRLRHHPSIAILAGNNEGQARLTIRSVAPDLN